MKKANKESIADFNKQLEELKAKLNELQQEVKVTMTVRELSVMLGCSIRHTYKCLYEHEIPGRQLGSKWIISRERVNQWLLETPPVPTTQHFSNLDFRQIVGGKSK